MAKNEAKIRFTAETGDFNKSIKKSNDEMAKLRAELKLNDEVMKDTGTTVEGLEKKHQLLEEQLEVSKEKTEAMSQKVEAAKKIFGENSEEVRKLETQLINQQTAQVKLERAVESCSAELKAQKDAAKSTETATEKLTRTIDDQQKEVDDLKEKYKDAVLLYGKNSDEAKDLAREIGKLSGELKENKGKMDAAENAAKDLDGSLEKAGDGAKGAGGGFTVFKGTLSNLASEGIQMCLDKLNEFVDYLWGLPEETREIRQDFATLNTAFDNVGFGAETATDTWKKLYTIFGEDDRAVEAANNIARIAENEKDLNDWVKITTGIWGTYQDSLAVESLAESAAETQRVGTVTGSLADALNWSSEAAKMFSKYMSEDVVTAEDAFNEALAECNTEQERQQLITETLTTLYGDAADTYNETSSAMNDAKKATADHILLENQMASAIEPVTTAWQELKNKGLEAALPLIEKITGWLTENEWAIKAFSTALKVVGAVLGGVLAVGVAFLTYLFALPIAITAAISLVVAFWDEIKAFFANLWETIKTGFKDAWDWIKNVFSTFGQWVYDNAIKPVADFFTGLWNGIKNGFITAWNAIKGFFSNVATWVYDNVIAPVLNFFTGLWNGIVSAYHTVIDPWIEIFRRISVIVQNEIITPIKQWFVDLWNSLVSGLRSAWNWCVSLVSTIAGWVNSKVIQPLKNIFTGLWTSLKNGVTTAVNAVKGVFGTVTGWINEKVIQPATNIFTGLWNGFVNGARKAWEGVKNVFSAVGGFFSKVFGIVKDKIVSVFQAGGRVFNNIKDGIVNVFKTVVNGIIKGLNKVITIPFKGLNDVLDSIHGVSIVGVKPFDWLTWRAPIPKIPLLAQGGILTQPTLNIAGEAGPEAVIPLDRLQSFIDTAVDRSLQVNNLQALVYAVEDLANRAIELNINGRRFATATASDTDQVNGNRMTLSKMGLALG